MAKAQTGETIHPLSPRLANESRHIELESGEHELHAFQALRRMDEVLAFNFMLFQDAVKHGDYDLVIADEAWDVDHFWHEHPELKKSKARVADRFRRLRTDGVRWRARSIPRDRLQRRNDRPCRAPQNCARPRHLRRQSRGHRPTVVRDRPSEHARLGAEALRFFWLHYRRASIELRPAREDSPAARLSRRRSCRHHHGRRIGRRRAAHSSHPTKHPDGARAASTEITGHRHGKRSRTIKGTFGEVTVAVPRARLDSADVGKTVEWVNQTIPRYQRRTKEVDALIAGAYLAGTNTRHAPRAILTSRYGVRGLAARGADFADTIRDPDVWRKTREGALVAGGWTVGLIRDLGAAFAKKKLEELTGLKL